MAEDPQSQSTLPALEQMQQLHQTPPDVLHPRPVTFLDERLDAIEKFEREQQRNQSQDGLGNVRCPGAPNADGCHLVVATPTLEQLQQDVLPDGLDARDLVYSSLTYLYGLNAVHAKHREMELDGRIRTRLIGNGLSPNTLSLAEQMALKRAMQQDLDDAEAQHHLESALPWSNAERQEIFGLLGIEMDDDQ